VPTTPVAFLFPGQGSQAVGMLSSVKDLPAVRSMLAAAQRVLGYDLLSICLTGPKAALDDTVHAQPALFIAGLAAVEKLRAENPALVDSVSACAGLSLGEYSALVFAGVLSLEDGLKVVKVRAESMALAAQTGSHGMLSVVGVADPELQDMCALAVKMGPPGCVQTQYTWRKRRSSQSHQHCPSPAPSAASPTSCSPRAAWCPATRARWRKCSGSLRLAVR